MADGLIVAVSSTIPLINSAHAPSSRAKPLAPLLRSSHSSRPSHHLTLASSRPRIAPSRYCTQWGSGNWPDSNPFLGSDHLFEKLELRRPPPRA